MPCSLLNQLKPDSEACQLLPGRLKVLPYLVLKEKQGNWASRCFSELGIAMTQVHDKNKLEEESLFGIHGFRDLSP